jgi:hypothetical protein
MKESEPTTIVTRASDEEIWSYVQEISRPHFQACPVCGFTEGQWYGFEREDRAVVYRRRKCGICKCIYRGATLVSAFGDVDTWEAKWLLSWAPFRESWLKERQHMDVKKPEV